MLPGYDTGFYRSVPLMIGGRLFAPTSLGQVALLDPATGEQKWVYNPKTWERGGTTMRPVGARGIGEPSQGSVSAALTAAISDALDGHIFGAAPITTDMIINHISGTREDAVALAQNNYRGV